MTQRRSEWAQLVVVPLVFAALAVGVLLVIVNLNSPVMAEIDRTSVVIVDGEMQASIQWPAGEEAVRRAEVALPLEYQTETRVPIDVHPDGTIEVLEPKRGIEVPPIALAVLVALIGALLGLVVVNTLRGYGYVRGTGEPGTMQPADVDEDRGFYWRS